MQLRLLTQLFVLMIFLSMISNSATKVVWEGKIEQAMGGNSLRYGAAMVDDPLASGGKALEAISAVVRQSAELVQEISLASKQ